MTVVPFMILLFGVVDGIGEDLENRSEEEIYGRLDKMSSELSTLLASQKSLAKGLARVPAVKQFAEVSSENRLDVYQDRAGELEAFFLNYQTAVPAIQGLRFIDVTGKTLVKVKEGKEIPPKYLDADHRRYYIADQSPKAFFKEALRTQEDVSLSNFELGQVVPGADFCPAMLRYSVPIKDELDIFQGLLVVNMWGTRIDETVEASLGGYPGNVYIVEMNDFLLDRDGIYLYHKDPGLRFANQTGAEQRFIDTIGHEQWNILHNSLGRGHLASGDGTMYFYKVFQPYPDKSPRWLLTVETSRDVILAPVLALKKHIWWLMAILVMLSLLIARWASARIAGPVNKLATMITRYAEGDHSVRFSDSRTDEIGIAGKAFNYMCESLEKAKQDRDKAQLAVEQSERLAAVGQLAAGIGHEINNPLMNIMSLADLIEKSIDDNKTEVRADLKTLQEEGRRCARIVQGILNFSRATTPSCQSFDMAELVTGTVYLLHHQFIKAEVKIDTHVEAPLVMEGDPNQLQQVLVNVLLNAIHASPAGSTVDISAVVDSEHVRLEITDHGEGVSHDAIHRVFNPFYTTKPEGVGTGLGLSVSYGIIKKHGGDISLENMPGGGVRVVIELPLIATTEEDETTEQPEEDIRRAAG